MPSGRLQPGWYHGVRPFVPGRRGVLLSVTARLQEEFFGIVTGRKEDRFGWLTYVEGG